MIQRRKKLIHPRDINLVIIIAVIAVIVVIAEVVVTMTITINDIIIPKKKKGILKLSIKSMKINMFGVEALMKFFLVRKDNPRFYMEPKNTMISKVSISL